MSRILYKYIVGVLDSEAKGIIGYTTITADGYVDAENQAERRWPNRVVSVAFKGKA